MSYQDLTTIFLLIQPHAIFGLAEIIAHIKLTTALSTGLQLSMLNYLRILLYKAFEK